MRGSDTYFKSCNNVVSTFTISSRNRREKGRPGGACVSVGKQGWEGKSHRGGNHELGISSSRTHSKMGKWQLLDFTNNHQIAASIWQINLQKISG